MLVQGRAPSRRLLQGLGYTSIGLGLIGLLGCVALLVFSNQSLGTVAGLAFCSIFSLFTGFTSVFLSSRTGHV